MALNITQDHARFRQIVHGKIRDNLRRYISQGELIGKQGKDVISIPIPQIEIPRLRFGSRQQGGAGQGDGDPGDPVQMPGQPGQEGSGKAGSDAGQHALEIDVTLDELADILGEELELPNVENRGKQAIREQTDTYIGVRNVGPDSLRHFKRTYRNALRRQIALGNYDPSNPVVVPSREDMRYRSWKRQDKPVTNAVILYMMDVSGSMGQEQKDIVRIESFWIDTWLSKHYRGIATRFVIHDATAREVDRDTFFRTRESGGTMISSAYKLASQMIDNDYPSDQWNIYVFHFSDGDNWSVDDTLACIDLLKERLLPRANMFGYGQVESPYGSGQFIKDLRDHFPGDERLVTSEIRDREAVIASIKEFLGKGR